MRSLVSTKLAIGDYSSLGPSSGVVGIAVDPDLEHGMGYVAVQRTEEGVEVDIIRFDPTAPSTIPDVSTCL